MTSKLFKEFFESEKSSGILLIICTCASILISNSGWGHVYVEFWNLKLGYLSTLNWINDALMAVFFLLIGLELEREVYIGELSKLKDALLPIIAALGGMVIPCIIYFLFNKNMSTLSGIGIPMATDIAFAIAILSLLGSRVPVSFKIFLTAFAVIDDLGAIIVIASLYSKGIIWTYLFIVIVIWLILFVLNRLKIINLTPYLIGGVLIWYFIHLSGVHASISGVILAFVIPFGNGSKESLSYKLQHWLHKPVGYIILPLFALANTAILMSDHFSTYFSAPFSIGILLGLIIGKPLGIFLFSYIAQKMNWIQLPTAMNFRHIIGLGCLGGIGFTMSIFITNLAFEDADIIAFSKWTILIASLLSSIVGLCILYLNTSKNSS